MKSLVSVVALAAMLGVGLGVVWAYFEVPSAANQQVQIKKTKVPKQAGQTPSAPKAEVPETVFNFGSIEKGATMSHVFKIRNVGGQPLYVDVESTTCKCTVGNMSDNEIPPGGETDVLLEWTAKTDSGPFRHGAVLSSNDPSQRSIQLSAEGLVVESTAMYPSELMFGSIRTSETATAEMFVLDFLDQELKISDYEIADEEIAKNIEVRITPTDPGILPSPDATSGLKVTATLQAGRTVGPFQTWLTLSTNLAKAETLTVPILGNVVGDISIFGPGWNAKKGLLRMGSFSGKEGKKTVLKVAVRGPNANDSKLEVAEVDPPQLKVAVGESRQMGEELQHVPLTIELPPGSPPMVRSGEPISSDAHVVLRSTHEEMPDVRLRVQFTVE